MYLGLPARRVCLASISRPVSNHAASEYRKYLAEGNRLSLKCDNSRDFTPTLPSLLPRYIIRLFRFAISYIPHTPLGILSMFARVNNVHRLAIGMIPSLFKKYCVLCYNITVHDMPTAGVEPARQFASKFQTCDVCQFHHVGVQSGGSAPAKLLLPLTTITKGITLHGVMSIPNVANINNNACNFGGRLCLSALNV